MGKNVRAAFVMKSSPGDFIYVGYELSIDPFRGSEKI